MKNDSEADIRASGTDMGKRVQPVPFGHVNIYFIATAEGHILVDAGMPKKEKELDEAFKTYGVDPRSVQLIILTHAHLDHVGSVAYAKKVSGGKILCHRAATEYLAKGEAEPAVPRNFIGRLLNVLTRLSGSKFEAVHPDIVIDNEYDLGEFGIGGRIIHTPGHSASSVSIILENGEALIGDMVRGADSGQISLGMFFDNKRELLESLEKVAAHESEIIYLSHGATIDNQTLKITIEENRGPH